MENPIERTETIYTTTTTSTTTFKPSLYQLIFGDDGDNEYYTWEPPFIDKEVIRVSNLIQKVTLTEEIYNKVIEINYNLKLPEGINNQIKYLKDGILIKVVDPAELDWLHKDLKMAEEQLKEETLIAYKALVPTLIEKVNRMKQAQSLKKNNDFIDLD